MRYSDVGAIVIVALKVILIHILFSLLLFCFDGGFSCQEVWYALGFGSECPRRQSANGTLNAGRRKGGDLASAGVEEEYLDAYLTMRRYSRPSLAGP